ncbi:hypothetical protein [Sphaerisporangium sp. TRM90804]|uniref:hypothetical protein n=1 Tax=Sphaerisporangium sp. TRM90804 TaxID=3031113 RepID=UPI0024494D4C|nr:hypothetical protein [Sphaerisporangium sp. TRM90804]MDH2429477.1 hypothetical protein [Sphaerisporangium sp. TRM90804]
MRARHAGRTALLVTLAVLGLSPLAGGTASARAGAASGPATVYQIEVTFTEYSPVSIDDCMGESACDYAEVYASLSAQAFAPDNSHTGEVRNIARFVNPGSWCETYPGVPWDSGTGFGDNCLKRVHDTKIYNFKDVVMCPSTTYSVCGGPHGKNNHRIVLSVRPDDRIYTGVHIKDYDELSPDDDICKANVTTEPFTEAQLQTLNDPLPRSMSWWGSGDGGCSIKYSFKKIGTA